MQHALDVNTREHSTPFLLRPCRSDATKAGREEIEKRKRRDSEPSGQQSRAQTGTAAKEGERVRQEGGREGGRATN